VALVTGASRGIGSASCLALARAGVAVAVGYRSDAEGAEETVAKARAEGVPALAVVEQGSTSFEVRATIEGRVAGVLVRDGEPVLPGQPLVWLMPGTAPGAGR
jgi:3-oxoacyl-[acyl-carrier protein] reductase